MVPGEALFQARRLVIRRDPRDPLDGDGLHEDVRGLEDERADGRRMGAGVDECDRRAVAVTEKDRVLELEMLEDGREHLEGLLVHVADRPLPAQGVGAAVTRPAVDESAAAGRGCQAIGKIPPHRDAAKALVQENDRGRVTGTRPDPAVFQAPPEDLEARQRVVRPRVRGEPRPRRVSRS